MSHLLPISELKSVLEDNFCADHDIKPVIEFSENLITIKCCCQQFHSECVALARELAEMSGFSDLVIK